MRARLHDTVPYHPISPVPRRGSCHDNAGTRRMDRLFQVFCCSTGDAAAQPAKLGCTSAPTALGTQTLRCPTAITIVSRKRRKVRAQGSQPRRPCRFRRTQQQGPAARGAEEAGRQPVRRGDAAGDRRGARHQMGGRRRRWQRRRSSSSTAASASRGPPAAAASCSAPAEGVDVEATGELIVKRWPPARVAALMARLGQ